MLVVLAGVVLVVLAVVVVLVLSARRGVPDVAPMEGGRPVVARDPGGSTHLHPTDHQ